MSISLFSIVYSVNRSATFSILKQPILPKVVSLDKLLNSSKIEVCARACWIVLPFHGHHCLCFCHCVLVCLCVVRCFYVCVCVCLVVHLGKCEWMGELLCLSFIHCWTNFLVLPRAKRMQACKKKLILPKMIKVKKIQISQPRHIVSKSSQMCVKTPSSQVKLSQTFFSLALYNVCCYIHYSILDTASNLTTV